MKLGIPRWTCMFMLGLSGSAGADWASTTSMDGPRVSNNSGVVLPDGKVVYASGAERCDSAVYSPDTQTWIRTDSSPSCHRKSPAALLNDGTVLSAGQPGVRSAAVFDSALMQWRLVQPTLYLHLSPMVAIGDGAFLFGGSPGLGRECEIYDRMSESWIPKAPMTVGRADHSATLLLDGTILVAGGFSATAEIYDPSTDTWRLTGSMLEGRVGHTAALLNDGRVLVVGGNVPPPRAEIFDPATGTWSPTASPRGTFNWGHVTVILNDGRVLLAGGGFTEYGDGVTNVAQLFDPSTETWVDAGLMGTARQFPMAVRLLDGSVLVAGGYDGMYCQLKSCVPTVTSTAEIYTP